MWEFETALGQVIPRTPTVRSFRFPIRAGNVRFRPGQYFFITIKVKGQDAEHHFSFSNSPTEKGYVEFTKRITNSDFSQTLATLTPGAWARLRGPLGGFTLPLRQRKLSFISGGIGITPLRSMLRYIVDRGLDCDVTLLYGNSSPDEIVFREELDGFARRHDGIRVVHSLPGGNVPPGWNGRRSIISSGMVRDVMPDFMDRRHYISGPPRMVLSLQEQLAALGVPAQQIRTDSFTGYD